MFTVKRNELDFIPNREWQVKQIYLLTLVPVDNSILNRFSKKGMKLSLSDICSSIRKIYSISFQASQLQIYQNCSLYHCCCRHWYIVQYRIRFALKYLLENQRIILGRSFFRQAKFRPQGCLCRKNTKPEVHFDWNQLLK